MAIKKQAQRPSRTHLPLSTRVVVAFALPIAAAAFVGTLTGTFANDANRAPVMAALGVTSLLVGVAFYGILGLGLKGGRPLFAGIGFATLGWVTFLVLRAIFIPINPEVAGSTRAFVYYLLFEAFAVQLWSFGLLFRATADWRGGLTAAIVSGIVFGATAYLLFQNIYLSSPLTLIYLATWGIFYGIIRLRTGTVLGTFIIQALQCFTAWVALGALPPETAESALLWVYGLSSLFYALFIWRLWPKMESDYRV
jgi:hypothetical protein